MEDSEKHADVIVEIIAKRVDGLKKALKDCQRSYSKQGFDISDDDAKLTLTMEEQNTRGGLKIKMAEYQRKLNRIQTAITHFSLEEEQQPLVERLTKDSITTHAALRYFQRRNKKTVDELKDAIWEEIPFDEINSEGKYELKNGGVIVIRDEKKNGLPAITTFFYENCP